MADKQISQLIAAETVNDDDLLVLQQGQVAKKLTGKKLGDYVYAAATDKIAEVNEAVAEAQIAVERLIEDKDEIVAVIASMAGLGTDTTLTQTGMAADSKTVGDKMTLLAGNITGVLSSRTVTTNIPKGKLVIFNYNLYKTTAAIASGELLTPGTNCTATTLAAELEAIEDSIDVALATQSEKIEAIEETLTNEGLEDFVVGTSEQLLADTGVTDQVPYLFRKAPDNSSRLTDKIVGGTIAWNQLFRFTTNSNTMDGITIATSASGAVRVSGKLTGSAGWKSINIGGALSPKAIANHVYLTCGLLSGHGIASWYHGTFAIASADNGSGRIVKPQADAAGVYLYVDVQTTDDMDYTFYPQVFDLTQMFGSAVADQIYAMETANAGAGVAYFKSLFQKPYYAYNAGELMSVNTSAHVTRGFNQWDEDWENGYVTNNGENYGRTDTTYLRSKNYIRVIPNTLYYMRYVAGGKIIYFNSNHEAIGNVGISQDMQFTTPSNACYIRFWLWRSASSGGFVTYDHDICINIFDPAKNGTYVPYEAPHTYPLDSSLTLRGIPKLDANNKVYYDGDTYESDGKVTRKYGMHSIVDSDVTQAGTASTGVKYAQVSLIGCKSNGYAKMAKYAYYNSEVAPTEGGVVRIISGSAYIYDNSFTDLATAKSLLAGLNIVYELATHTTETADPFTNPQICSPYGTEEYVDERTVAVPVGHDTFYHEDLKVKIEGLPWDLSMIAPIENGATASQAYAQGKFFMRNNQFCKAKTSIASGASFTLGTNYEVTTVAAELFSALS